MQKNSAKSINQVLSGDCGGLRALVVRARQLHQLTALLRRHLPVAMRDHCTVSGVDGQTLIVCADSAAWASKLRFHAPTLVPAMRALPALGDVQQLRVKIAPVAVPVTIPAAARRPFLSSASARAIGGCADAMGDTALKSALQRLATRTQKRCRGTDGKD